MQAAAKRILPGAASLVLRLHRGGVIAARMLSRREGFGLFALHVIGARVGDIHRQLSAERTHVRHELPNLILRDLPGERRHAVRPAFHDRVVDLPGFDAVNPVSIYERRTDTASTIGVTSRAVVGTEKTFALRDGIRILLVRIGKCWCGSGRAGMKLAELHVMRGSAFSHGTLEVARFA